ncbi:MAG: DnaJ domain-containing protein [Calditrichia bacterium]
MKNLYKVLGVLPSASADEIKKAYRNLILRYHPDRGRTGDREKFLEVQNAFETLGRPEKREQYNHEFNKPFNKSAYNSNHLEEQQLHYRSGILEDMLNLFSSPLFPDFPFVKRQPALPLLEIELTPAESRRGGTLNVPFKIPAVCRSCNGSGYFGPQNCPFCKGEGRQFKQINLPVEIPQVRSPITETYLNLSNYGIPELLPVRFIVR